MLSLASHKRKVTMSIFRIQIAGYIVTFLPPGIEVVYIGPTIRTSQDGLWSPECRIFLSHNLFTIFGNRKEGDFPNMMSWQRIFFSIKTMLFSFIKVISFVYCF